MLTHGIFPRDAHGNLLTKRGCQSPGCHHPNWHVCLIGKQSEFNDAVERLAARLRGKKRMHPGNAQALADGRDERWARIREENRPRDEKLIEMYKRDDIGIRKLALKFGISYQTARRVLIDYGVDIRPQGENLKNRDRVSQEA